LKCKKHPIDAKRFKELYENYWSRLFSYCYHHTQDREQAMDLVQDIFFNLWKRHETLQIDEIENYLFKSAVFEVADYFRSKQVRAKRLSLLEKTQEEYHQSSEIISKDLENLVNKLVQQLPERCREVYQKSRSLGLSHREISQELGISENTVKVHIHTALAYLREQLMEEEII